ncbi:3'-5' exonuclease [Dactylosporangium sp. AC04546]|uniref:3'-5' exonuclease n=1 Tax=Dactylosporangium sp. AC04546 TaxID=2862460 RepID=UPI002E7C3B8D|nr:3'-5' exonuclease [Dactylosporangium sp. AC04546]WVK89681.1 3'-5' exonuclease [Dactylosporangium sp. AC04546]
MEAAKAELALGGPLRRRLTVTGSQGEIGVVHPTIQTWSARPWHAAPLVAIDLEGSGAQDHEQEAILEIAAVPLLHGVPDTDTAYTTLINPGRSIPPRSWISPGLGGDALSDARALATVEPELAARLNARILVGHNIGVDWRLLHRRCLTIAPAALLDTHKLARSLINAGSRSLSNLINALNLTAAANAAAPGSQPHRALWDTTATALLLTALIARGWPSEPALSTVLAAAGQPLHNQPPAAVDGTDAATLF